MDAPKELTPKQKKEYEAQVRKFQSMGVAVPYGIILKHVKEKYK